MSDRIPEEVVHSGDVVHLQIAVNDAAPGDEVHFTVLAGNDKVDDSLHAKVRNGAAEVRWTVDVKDRTLPLDLDFEASLGDQRVPFAAARVEKPPPGGLVGVRRVIDLAQPPDDLAAGGDLPPGLAAPTLRHVIEGETIVFAIEVTNGKRDGGPVGQSPMGLFTQLQRLEGTQFESLKERERMVDVPAPIATLAVHWTASLFDRTTPQTYRLLARWDPEPANTAQSRLETISPPIVVDPRPPFFLKLEQLDLLPQGLETDPLTLDLRFDDGSTSQVTAQVGVEIEVPNPAKNSALSVTAVHTAGKDSQPVRWLLTGGQDVLAGVHESVQIASRLRFSIFDFNPSFIKELIFDGPQKKHAVGVELDDDLLVRFQKARFDDYCLVRIVTFAGADKEHNAHPPVFRNFSPLGTPPNPAGDVVREDYLRKLADALHAHGQQLSVGYEMVERGTGVSQLGKQFRDWLAAASIEQVKAHAQAIADFFKQRKIPIDGIGFDFELNGFGSVDEAKIGALFSGTAEALKDRNGLVHYDNGPFQPDDGVGSSGIMTQQKYRLAAGAPNIVARPMCYNGTITTETALAASIACALRQDAKGGGLRPSQVQYSIDVSRMTTEKIVKWCSQFFRPSSVGATIFTMPGGTRQQADFFARAEAWEAALNPGMPPPRATGGQPLQVPTFGG